MGQCDNLLKNQIRNILGHEIADAGRLRSPLYVLPPEKGAVLEDKTTQNLWIKAKWSALLPHLKWALTLKLRVTGLMFTFRVIDDLKIKSVFVGSEAYKARPSSVRDNVPIYNTLEDLAGPDLDLVIIRLGALGYKNVSAAGALKECLLMRDGARKPTWLVEEGGDRAWKHSRDSDVESYVESRYEVFDLTSQNKEVGGILVDEDDNPAPVPIRVPSKPAWRAPVEESPREDIDLDDIDFLNSGGSKKKKFRKGGGW